MATETILPLSTSERELQRRLSSLDSRSPLARYKDLELTLHEHLSAQDVLSTRQQLLALARTVAHTGEGAPHLLAEATMHLAAAYGRIGLHTQALSHANTSVMLSHELCEFLEQWPLQTDTSTHAPQLWQNTVHLLARLELNKYRSSHDKTDLLRSLAHFEAAFPVVRQLQDIVCDEPLPESTADYLEKNFELTACIGEVYAAMGSEEVSLGEGCLARMQQQHADTPAAVNPDQCCPDTAAEEDDGAAVQEQHLKFLATQQRTAGEVAQSVWKARQTLDIALQLLQICEQQVETSIAVPQLADTLNKFGSFNSRQEPEALLKHLQTRVNECLYNMALADTMDCSRERHSVLREAKGKLYEVMGRAAASDHELPWPLQGQVLKLLGQTLLELEHPQDAAQIYGKLCEALRSMCSRPGATHSSRDESEDCDLQWAIALRKAGDPRSGARILSRLHHSMKCKLPRWHNRLIELEKELEVNVSMHKHT